jgi:uncharacterized protein (TIGR03032 family)
VEQHSEEFTAPKPVLREVRYEYTPTLARILEHLGVSLLVSTYQAGKLAVLGTHGGKLTVALRNFERAMGVAVCPQAIAVGTRRQIHLLRPAHELANRLEPAGTYDRCWVPRTAHYTGNVHGHDLAWGRDGLWVVNTLFSALCTLHDDFNFVPRWQPRFISELIDQDRCHLNGLAMSDGQPKFVTAMAESNEPAGWRPTKATSGCVIDVPSGETIARGFAMPHSPRWYDGRLWVLDSGRGRLVTVDPANGQIQPVEEVPGYTRGLAFAGQFAFVGLSRIRETSVFGGVPIAERREQLKCGIAVVDLLSGRSVAAFQFLSGVEEIFAVDVLPGTRNPALFGPSPEEDDQREIWIVPPPGRVPETSTPRNPLFGPGISAAAEPPVPPPPADAKQLAATGQALHRAGRLTEAAACLQKAATVADDPAPVLSELGNVYQELGNQDRALECYREAVRKNPNFVPARQNLGYLLFNHGEPHQALEHYAAASRVQPSPLNRLLAALVLPVIYDSTEDVAEWRQNLETRLRQLVEEGATVDATRTMLPTSFFLAYQGRNDRDVMRNLGRLYRGENAMDGRRPSADKTDRLRVGFLSAYFRDHTIGRLNLGRIRHLSRTEFEVCVLFAARGSDAVTDQFRQAADRFVPLPRDVVEARRLIVAQNLDVLIFADVGMDALTSTLAYSRMAPVQCVTWGHPDTTGSPFLDYFLSSDLLEVEQADEHYTERLARLPNLATFFERPVRSGPLRSREFFGLDPRRHVYLCPHTLFKFHPEFDALLAGILDADPQGDIVLLEGRVANWTRRLRARFARSLPDADRRVKFLPAQPRDDFLALLALSDVLIDPLHFGGGHTSYEAIAMGTPVVTLPGQFLRSRITQALYRRVGVTDTVVGSPDEFVKVAVSLATCPEKRADLCRRIGERSHVLFENPDDVRSLEEFLRSVRR